VVSTFFFMIGSYRMDMFHKQVRKRLIKLKGRCEIEAQQVSNQTQHIT
jgi:hypothetical protein